LPARPRGLPAISGGREFAVAGLLVAYGASIFDVLRRTGAISTAS
jgi:hypothetical protein